MQTLYLIRHTKPDIEPGICYGQLDIDVAASFENEANHILRCLPQLELVIASPLLRAHRLGEAIAQAQGCPLRSDARLIEKHFGAWEGKARDEEVLVGPRYFFGSVQYCLSRTEHLLSQVRDHNRELYEARKLAATDASQKD